MENTKTSGYAPVNGLNMYYEIHGEGSMPLVLIHGGGSTIGTSFGNLIPLLSGCGKLLAVELQAHGRTSDRDEPESFEQDADDVAALLKYLKMDKANFLGFSNGGTTAVQIAIRHREIVKKIVAVSANFKREGMMTGFFDAMQNASLDDMPGPLKTAFLELTQNNERLQIMFNKDRERMLHFKDIPDDVLRSIQVPILLMVCDRDVVSSGHVDKMSNLIPNARLAILPGSHGSMIGEICAHQEGSKLPGITAILVEEFLNE